MSTGRQERRFVSSQQDSRSSAGDARIEQLGPDQLVFLWWKDEHHRFELTPLRPMDGHRPGRLVLWKREQWHSTWLLRAMKPRNKTSSILVGHEHANITVEESAMVVVGGDQHGTTVSPFTGRQALHP